MPALANPDLLKNTLLQALEKVVPTEVIKIDQAFYASRDKFAFLKAFQSRPEKKSPLSPILLTQWMHYCWIRLEISNLVNQRLLQAREAVYLQAVKSDPDRDFLMPALLNSVNDVIRTEKYRGTPIADTIQVIAKICLQVVGTEHPTDPLQQDARNALTKLAEKITSITEIFSAEQTEQAELQQAEIQAVLRKMFVADPIPEYSREVVEEVGRDTETTLRQFYEILPAFIDVVMNAYKTYYPKEFPEHEEAIWRALYTIARDVTWAGGDADNNVNITPEATINSVRIRRIRAAEKHINTMDTSLIKKTKALELQYRTKISKLHDQQFKLTQQLAERFHDFERESGGYVANRAYEALRQHCQLNSNFTPEILLQLAKIQKELQKNVDILIKLATFSGSYRTIAEDEIQLGDLQLFQAKLREFKTNIQLDTSSIGMGDAGTQKVNASVYVVGLHEKIMADHADLLGIFPDLGKAMRHFGIQLRCYGMSYGAAHVRQDSSVFVEVWNTILQDLKKSPEFNTSPVFTLLGTKTYKELHPDHRAGVQKLLQDNSVASNALLAEIYRRKKNEIYLKAEEYRDKKEFAKVRSELERIEAAVRHADMFENIVISNTENLANLLEVDSLKRIFPFSATHLATVPLLEKREDLDNAGPIMEQYIQLQIINRVDAETAARLKADVNYFPVYVQTHKEFLNSLEIEVMCGYSDTERVSGLAALISIQQAQENFHKLAAKYGVRAKIFHGQGGDLLRGGLHMVKSKMTAQGNMRNLRFGTAAKALQFREEQFAVTYQGIIQPTQEFARLPFSVRELLHTFYAKGANFYEFVHNTKNGLGNMMAVLFGWGPNWIVNILNSSSRAPQRGGSQNHSDRTASVQTGGLHPEGFVFPGTLRAITAVQINDLLCGYFNIIIGPGRAMRELCRQLNANGETVMNYAPVIKLYHHSATFREIFEKTAYGLAMTDFTIAREAYFGADDTYKPRDAFERKTWADYAEMQLPLEISEQDIKAKLKTVEGRAVLTRMLAMLFALMEEEYIQTTNFIFAVNKILHAKAYNANEKFFTGTDLLKHYPDWHDHVVTVLEESEPLSMQLALMNKAVAEGKKLDVLYPGLNDAKWENSSISGIAHLVGSVGIGMTAKRYMDFPIVQPLELRPQLTVMPDKARFFQKHAATMESLTSVISGLSVEGAEVVRARCRAATP